MDRNSELYKVGLALHGHKCPAMPLGLRAGLAAMEALGVEHAPDGQLTALVEMDRNHCSTCFADGVQVATGCTFGKGNIRSLGYGKFALTLIDNKTSRSVRVIPTVKTMRRNQESEFLGLRREGHAGLSNRSCPVRAADRRGAGRPSGRSVQGRADQTGSPAPMLPHAFDTIICAECGEMAVERYARVKQGKIVCMPCAEKVGG